MDEKRENMPHVLVTQPSVVQSTLHNDCDHDLSDAESYHEANFYLGLFMLIGYFDEYER